MVAGVSFFMIYLLIFDLIAIIPSSPEKNNPIFYRRPAGDRDLSQMHQRYVPPVSALSFSLTCCSLVM